MLWDYMKNFHLNISFLPPPLRNLLFFCRHSTSAPLGWQLFPLQNPPGGQTCRVTYGIHFQMKITVTDYICIIYTPRTVFLQAHGFLPSVSFLLLPPAAAPNVPQLHFRQSWEGRGEKAVLCKKSSQPQKTLFWIQARLFKIGCGKGWPIVDAMKQQWNKCAV